MLKMIITLLSFEWFVELAFECFMLELVWNLAVKAHLQFWIKVHVAGRHLC